MILGIDLGTTHSLGAIWTPEGPRLVPNALGEVLTPSCVGIDGDGTVLVGQAARERLQSHPDRTTSLFKRTMGSERTTHLAGRPYRPEELSALVLRALKEDAEALTGACIEEAVITVPAYFSDAQRKATRAAAQLAGLKADRLLNEPTAAALAYGMHTQMEESKFLVFDLGGGTFDVSILELFEGVMEVRASAGDNRLGGEDVVNLMVDHAFQSQGWSTALQKDPVFMQKLVAQLEGVKRSLSTATSAGASFHHRDALMKVEMDQATLERLCAPLLERLRTPIERALRDARLMPGDLDAIVLAGGSSRMPMVQNLVATMFGRPPKCDLNPDQVVALGAAVQAGLVMKNEALKDIVMTDVAPYSLGIEVTKEAGGMTMPGHFDPILERNCVIPVSRVKQYAPVRDGQTEIDLKVFQGEARLVKDNIPLGMLKISLPKGTRAEGAVDVRFTYDRNGLLEVEALVLKTKELRRLVIQENPGLLTEAEIEARFQALSTLKIHPREHQVNRALIARGDRLYGILNLAVRERFGEEMALFDAALASQDERTIAKARQRLEQVMDQVEQHLVLETGSIQ